MAYETPPVGTVLPAKENANPKIENPGPVHGATGDGLNEWLQAQAQDKSYQQNLVLVKDWHAAQKNSPEYAQRLGADFSWAVVVIEAPAGGVTFDQQKVGPAVSTLEA